jgi:cobalt-zinc-cadmium efflux system membrane fusion protein
MRLTAGLVALGLSVAAAGCSKHVATQEPSAAASDSIRLEKGHPNLQFIKFEKVEQTDAAGTVTFPARVAFDEDHTQRLATPVDGRAVALLVKVGDKVKLGQPLVRLSSPEIGQLQSDAQRALQDLTLAEKTVERAHKLKMDGAISEKEVVQAEADMAKAKSGATQAAARLAAINVPASDPGATVVLTAQVAGTVVERNVLVGQEVRADATTPLLTITNLDVVWVLADVYEQDLALVQTGAAISVRVPAYPGEKFAGKIAHLGDIVDSTSRTVKLRSIVANPDARLKPEMFAKLDLTLAPGGPKVILVSSKAVLCDGEQSRVIVANGDMFRLRVVDVGPEADGRVRVLSGLTPGETVVTDGALFLKAEIVQR